MALVFSPTGSRKGGLEMDAKGLELLTMNPGVITNVRTAQKAAPAIKPVESIKKTSHGTTASDTQKHEGKNMINWMQQMTPREEDAQLASEILAESLADSPDLEVGWRYDQDRRLLVVEVKDKKTGEVVRQLPPEDILSSLQAPESEGNGALLNRVA